MKTICIKTSYNGGETVKLVLNRDGVNCLQDGETCLQNGLNCFGLSPINRFSFVMTSTTFDNMALFGSQGFGKQHNSLKILKHKFRENVGRYSKESILT